MKAVVDRAMTFLGLKPEPADHFLSKVKGVIHVGANSGQERDTYAAHGLDVLWIEPIPEVFTRLERFIAKQPKQRALRELITDRDGASYDFHVANNNGASSSILDFAEHKDIWPEVTYERTIKLTSVTLDTLLAREGIDASGYQGLVMDTQGSELMVLKGATRTLKSMRFIKTEAADFEAYAGCARVDDLTSFLATHGFSLTHKEPFAEREAGGRYFELVFKRVRAG
ncbi:MAG: FkbM family methyltransferase [Hyphomicrobiaceae bacterium]|nr:FkbM family methyltransferase [Hyphomicrobiaceae bacterium]